MSNFGMGLKELGIGQTFALTPQAKGRIERLWNTFHDRLTAELRLAGIKDIEEDNKFLPRFLARHKGKFAIEAQEKPVYVPLDRKIDFTFLFAQRATRKTDNGGVISYEGCFYAQSEEVMSTGLARVSVEVRKTLDGRGVIVRNGQLIEMRKVEKPKRANVPQSEKESRPAKAHRPASDHPWRHSPVGKARLERDITVPAAYAS